MAKSNAWERLNRRIVDCEHCPRLRVYCRKVAVEKRRAFADCDYWGRPVPNFGDRAARMLIVGLAPAAHGANRTGRMFTGDRSGDFLFAALHRAGFANRPEGRERDDGLELIDCAITATCHCAPPDNKPTRDEIANCREWFTQTAELLPVRVFLALGQVGWRTVIDYARTAGWYTGRIPKFGHATQVQFATGQYLVGSYHPSQQNTFTGRLTAAMLDEVFATARLLISDGDR
jgi:uracil-DNA glycosylase